MNLSDLSNEATYLWLKDNFKFSEEKDTEHLLTWRLSVKWLMLRYKNWIRRTKFRELGPEELWGVIRIGFPNVKLIGEPGERQFTGIRIK